LNRKNAVSPFFIAIDFMVLSLVGETRV